AGCDALGCFSLARKKGCSCNQSSAESHERKSFHDRLHQEVRTPEYERRVDRQLRYNLGGVDRIATRMWLPGNASQPARHRYFKNGYLQRVAWPTQVEPRPPFWHLKRTRLTA